MSDTNLTAVLQSILSTIISFKTFFIIAAIWTLAIGSIAWVLKAFGL